MGVFGLKRFTDKQTVPRKPKATVENKPADDAAASSANGKGGAAEPKKKSRAAAASTKEKKPAAVKKSAAKSPASKTASKPVVEPTDDEIRLRAYFLAERRHRLSLPGDSNHDWIEARRQLIEESQRSRN